LYTTIEFLKKIRKYKNELNEKYKCQYYRNDGKKLQEAREPKFCKITIVYYYPTSVNQEKYIFKNKHSYACNLLYTKKDIGVNKALEDYDEFVKKVNDLLNSKTYFYK